MTAKQWLKISQLIATLLVFSACSGPSDASKIEVVKLGFYPAFGNDVPIGEVFRDLGTGTVSWQLEAVDAKDNPDLSQSDYFVNAKWQGKSGTKYFIQFLVTKKGLSFKPFRCEINNIPNDVSFLLNELAVDYSNLMKDKGSVSFDLTEEGSTASAVKLNESDFEVVAKYDSGNIRIGRTNKSAKLQDIALAKDLQISFYENGYIKSFKLTENLIVKDLPCKADTEVFFYPNGTLASCELTKSLVIQGAPCQRQRVNFFNNGTLKECFISEKGEIKGIPFASGNNNKITFHRNGNISMVFMSEDTEIGGIPCKAAPIILYPDGKVRQCTPSKNITLKETAFKNTQTIKAGIFHVFEPEEYERIEGIMESPEMTPVVAETEVKGAKATVVLSTEDSTLRLRKYPNINAEVIGVVKNNEAVTVIESRVVSDDERSWSKIQTRDGIVGYAADEFLSYY